MKHLRLFENFEDEENIDISEEEDDDDEDFEHYTHYNEGDYVKLDKDESEWDVIGLFAKIIEVNNHRLDEYENEMFEPRYKVNSIDKKTKSLHNFWIGESEIDCNLTPEEIKEFDLLLTANKFNI